MIVILGSIVVIGCVMGGFVWAGGAPMSLYHPSEILTIGGATLGAMIMMSSKKVLLDLMKCLIQALKGSPFNRATYTELFKLAYELMRLIRREGLLKLEPHLLEPEKSPLFSKYHKIVHNHHVMEFLCDGLTPLLEGNVDIEQMKGLLETEIKVIEEEHHIAVGVIQKAADALPGFGIVAAVLGIVITMGAIDGPVEEIGHKVGAALVGTFLGILASYGFLGPIAARMELLGAAEIAFFRTVSSIIISCSGDSSPKIAVEQARRGVGSEFRPHRAELETMLRDMDTAA